MTDSNNPVLGNPGTGSVNSSASISVGDITVEGNVEGHFVVGNNNQIYEGSVNNYYGDVYNLQVEEPIVKRHSVNPQPPRPPRGFVGRENELEILKRSISAGDATFVYGQEGLGKTSLAKQVAHSDPADQMSDGTVFIESLDESGKALGFEDVVQSLFDTFYNSTPPLKVNFANAKTYLSNTAPLVVLDSFDFPASAYDKFPDLFPKGAQLITNQILAADDDVFQTLELAPLARKDAIQLLAGKSGIAADINTQAVMDRICDLCSDVPLAITKLAKTIQRKHLDLSDVRTKLENVQPPSSERVQVAIERSFGVIFPLLSSAERAALFIVAAAPGISVDRAWLESVTQDQYAVEELEALELIQANSPRLRMSVGLRQVIYASPVDVRSRRNTLLTYLLDQLRSRSLDFDFIDDELGNILGLLTWAVDEKRWADVVTLGRAVDPYLTLRGFWDAWGNVLKWIYLAGKNLGDTAIQAWALHQLGSREIGIGTQKQAIDYLVRALRMRESLGDKVGAAYTRHNLNLILPPPPPPPTPDRLLGWIIAGLVFIAAIVILYLYLRPTPFNPCAELEGWQVYTVQDGDTLDSITRRIVLADEGILNEKKLPVVKLAIQSANSTINVAEGTPVTLPTMLTEVEEGQLICVPVVPSSFTPEPPRPLVTQAPSAIVPPTLTTPTCDAAQFVAHVTVPDGTTYAPGDTFVKTWRLRNIGSCTWTTSYSLVFDSGEQLGASNVINLTNNVAPGQYVDISLDMTAPDSLGHYISYWKLRNSNDMVFGTGPAASEAFWVEILITADGNSPVNLAVQVLNAGNVFNIVGQEVDYSYVVTNKGASPLSEPVEIFDNKVVAASCPNVNTVGDRNDALDPDENIICTGTYRLTQADIDTGSVTNLATARVGGENTSNEVSSTVVIAQVLSLEITKEADPMVYTRVGQEITYTYTVLNSSNVTLSPIQMFVSDDHINGGAEELPCEPETTELAPGETVTCTALYTIAQADIDAGSVTNRASASIHAYGYNLMENRNAAFGGNQTASTTVNYILPPTLEKTADRETYDAIDQLITYTYTVKNINAVPIPGPVTVKDDRVEVTCQELTNGGINSNQVIILATMAKNPSLGTGDPGVQALSQTQASPDLTMIVTYERIDQMLNFSYLVGNTSSLAIPGPVVVTDDKALVTCPEVTTVGNADNNLDPNEAITCTGNYTITQADLDAGSVTNLATASASGYSSAVITTTFPLEQTRALTLTQTANPTTYNQVGQEIVYSYVITNSGKVTLGPAQFAVNDDKLDVAIDCGSAGTILAPGWTVSCSAPYLITEADITAGSVTNSASASDGTITSNTSTATINRSATVPPSDSNLDPNQEITCTGTYTITQSDLDRGSVINQATAQVGEIDSNQETVRVEAIQRRELELIKTANPTTFDRVGQTITYTYEIKNVGNVTLGPTQFTVSDDHFNRSTSFNCGSDSTELAPKESFTCTNTYSISSADLDARSVTNKATASVIINQEAETSPPATNSISCTYPPAGREIYIVQSGDTLYNISTWYPDITVDRLMQENCLSSSNIRTGQTLYVPGPPPPATISGIVVLDINRDNIYTTDEPGVPDVTLSLIDPSTNVTIATTTTNSDGEYTFQVSNPGTYRIFQEVITISRPNQHETGVIFLIRPANSP